MHVTTAYPPCALTFPCCSAGLALYKGLVYAAFGSHCDRPQYWPWIFAFEAQSLKIRTFWTTPSFICEPFLHTYGLHCIVLCVSASLAQAAQSAVPSCCTQHLALMSDIDQIAHLCSILGKLKAAFQDWMMFLTRVLACMQHICTDGKF